MKQICSRLGFAAVLLGAATAFNAQAGGGHGGGHWGGYGGGPFFAPFDPRAMFGAMLLAPLLNPPPPPLPYYTTAPVALPAPAPLEAFPSQMDPAPPASANWYQRYWLFYCASSNAYYPDVLLCPEGWQQAAPRRAY
jgi:hypothetical protein